MRGGKLGPDVSAEGSAAASIVSIFIFSFIILGLSAHIISKDEGGKAIMTVHLVLSLVTVILAIIAIIFFDDASKTSAYVLFFMTIMWLAALIVLVADKKTRMVIHDEGQKYLVVNHTNPNAPANQPAASFGLGSGPFLGIVITDALTILNCFLAGCVAWDP